MLTKTFTGIFSFISRWGRSVSGMSLKIIFYGFFFLNCLLLWSIKVKVITLTLWQCWCSQRKEARHGYHSTKCFAEGGLIQSLEAKRSLAPDLMACWIRPRECTSEQPVPLAPGTEGKLHTHREALRYGCKKPRNKHIWSYFKKW